MAGINECREFLESLKAGDVVRVNGTLRVIRGVHVPPNAKRRSFDFAILKCSWTGRPYTVKSIYDLAQCKVELVMRNYKPKSAIEKALQDDIDARSCDRSRLTCCDIHGIT